MSTGILLPIFFQNIFFNQSLNQSQNEQFINQKSQQNL